MAVLAVLVTAVLVTRPTPAGAATVADNGETTVPAEVAPEPTVAVAPEPPIEPQAETPAEPDVPEDPMSNEGPGEEAPATDITVPPKKTYGDQEPFEPAQILWSSVAAAEDKLDDAIEQRQRTIVEVRRLRKRLKELRLEVAELDEETAATVEELMAATERLTNRAVVGFQRLGSGSEAEPEVQFSDYQQVLGSQRRSKMIDTALDFDEVDREQLQRIKARLSSDTVGLLDRIRVVGANLVVVTDGIEELDLAIEQAEIEYQAFRAGSEIFIHGVVFPIAGDYPTPLTDSYGFPRMPGTPDEHWHEGIDLFAARGTPLVATERGVVTRVGTGRLGGLKLWLKGESGSEWYYAHLDSFAPEIVDGLVVEAGQLLGYVGRTGNAVGTPPHLHMQLHPDGGRPVNPYPLLKVVSDMEQAAIAAGEHSGYEYQSHLVDHPEPEPPVDDTTTTVTTTTPPTTTAVTATVAPTAPPTTAATGDSVIDQTTATSSSDTTAGTSADPPSG